MEFDQAEGWLQIRKEQAIAIGKEVPEGFLVRVGSTAMRNGSPKVKRDRAERDRLVSVGILIEDENPALFRFSRDHIFSSKSVAAGVIIDGNSNGSHWSSDPNTSSSVEIDPYIFSRDAVEAAMDAFDENQKTGAHAEIFDRYKEPRQYWVRSTRDRKERRIYPSKPIVGYARAKHSEQNGLSGTGGWGQKYDSAARLHNSGFIIVDGADKPIEVPERYEHLIRGSDRIRLCALNYHVEPARELGAKEVTIRASVLSSEIGLSERFPAICSALESRKFQELAKVSRPNIVGPNPSSTTSFTYRLRENERLSAMPHGNASEEVSATNLILYGPPGTGKTYATIWEAVRLCLGNDVANNLKGQDKRPELKAKYDELVRDNRIEFVTFHQSYGYEDFVEGLQPATGAANGSADSDTATSTGFRLEAKSGVFRRICARAQTPRQTESAFDPAGRRVFKMSLGFSRDRDQDYIFEECIEDEKVLLGWSLGIDWSDPKYSNVSNILESVKAIPGHEDSRLGTGYVTFPDRLRNRLSQGDMIFVSRGNNSLRAIGEVVGPYFFDGERVDDMEHGRKVRWRWVSKAPESDIAVSDFFPRSFNQKSLYEMSAEEIKWKQLLPFIVTDSAKARTVPHVLIIDEINRGNISRIFGELITLIETGKRLGGEEELTVRLPYSGTSFGVPGNLHIIGTMNTADRSIALLDTALRRRFDFRELMPDPESLSDNVEGINLRKLLTTVNDRIEYLFDREHQIGHAYFTDCRTRAAVEEVMRHKIIPLLAEYFYDDWAKVALVLGDKPSSGSAAFLEAIPLKAPNGMTDEDVDEQKLRWRVKSEFNFSEFEA